jgi:cytochrome P450
MFCSTVLEDEPLDQIVGAIAYIEHNMPVQAPLFLPLPGNLAFKHYCRQLRGFCAGLIRDRRNAPDKPDDFLTYLLAVEDATLQRNWNDDEILDQLLAVLLGASAIATPLFWTAYLLSVQPATCRRVLDEYRAVCGDRKVASYEDTKSLAYFEWVVQESMRLYPPFWGNIRFAEQPFQVGGYAFPKNSVFLLLRYFANRHPGYWRNPQAFDPERFDAANPSRIKPRYFIPFGAGPRTCLGVHMSVPICKMILGRIFGTYDFAYPATMPNGQPKIRFMYGLYPRNDILLRVSRRG